MSELFENLAISAVSASPEKDIVQRGMKYEKTWNQVLQLW